MDMQKIDDMEDDIVNSLAILRSFHRKDKDTVGVRLVTEHINEIRVFFNELREELKE